MRLKMLLLVPMLAAMGSGVTTDRPPPPPVSLPQRTLRVPQAIPADTVPPFAALRVLSAEDVRPDEFLWQARPIVVFANTTADLSFVRQLSALQANAEIDELQAQLEQAETRLEQIHRRLTAATAARVEAQEALDEAAAARDDAAADLAKNRS